MLQIRDNGVGMAIRSLEAKESLGLLGMRERARSAGGELRIKSRPELGTTVSVSLPAR